MGPSKTLTPFIIQKFAQLSGEDAVMDKAQENLLLLASINQAKNAVGEEANDGLESDNESDDNAEDETLEEIQALQEIVHQIFGNPQCKFPADCTNTLDKNEGTGKTVTALRFLCAKDGNSLVKKGALVPVRIVDCLAGVIHPPSKIAGPPELTHLQLSGDGDVGFYEALSRAIWGIELFGLFLGHQVQQELELHADFYRQRVGIGFFGCCTKLWPTVCEVACANPLGVVSTDDDHAQWNETKRGREAAGKVLVRQASAQKQQLQGSKKAKGAKRKSKDGDDHFFNSRMYVSGSEPIGFGYTCSDYHHS
jgi:hypothetical protein